jgi:hypothetical protein
MGVLKSGQPCARPETRGNGPFWRVAEIMRITALERRQARFRALLRKKSFLDREKRPLLRDGDGAPAG